MSQNIEAIKAARRILGEIVPISASNSRTPHSLR